MVGPEKRIFVGGPFLRTSFLLLNHLLLMAHKRLSADGIRVSAGVADEQ
jgi:hypothetical protein